MLTMTLTTWLLAATPAPADAPVAVSFELQPAEQSRLSLALCFKGSGQQVRFRLKVRSSGRAGSPSRTRMTLSTRMMSGAVSFHRSAGRPVSAAGPEK